MWDQKPKEFPKTMRVGRRRKDGKIPVTYNFPTAGRTITKLKTPEQVQADIDAGDYVVIR